MARRPPVLVDTMIVIEAIRTGCWNALTGQQTVVTVETCARELRRGDPLGPGYVPVSEEQLRRAAVQALAAEAEADFLLKDPEADGLDPGERDLLALAATRTDNFRLCSADKAAVTAAHRWRLLDRVVSLEVLAEEVGVRPDPSLKAQFTEARMRMWRTSLRLGGSL